MNPLVVIQARTDSARFPAKALASFRGFPLVVLAAKRAANTGLKVIIATSNSSVDDMLAQTAIDAGFGVFRGPKQDVLRRICGALDTCPHDSPVVRLTADNVVPDGELILEILNEFYRRNLKYLTTTDVASGLPYGVSVEVTRAALLREANVAAKDASDREHVTAWIRRKYGHTVFTKYNTEGAANYRVTVDCLDDLVSLDKVFPLHESAVSVSWRSIVSNLKNSFLHLPGRLSGTELILGTAQLGMDYGIARSCALDPDESGNILRLAVGAGVSELDTARAYGHSEELIGRFLKSGWGDRTTVTTKLSPLEGFSPHDTATCVKKAAEKSLFDSLSALGLHRLECVLLHRVEHWYLWDGVVAELLSDWRKQGRIVKLGVSVQTPDELKYVLSRAGTFQKVQMPLNILDHRWETMAADINRARVDHGLQICARSALLQGLLPSEDEDKWRIARVDNAKDIIEWLRHAAATHASGSVPRLCLDWLRSVPWVDAAVVGVDSVSQLRFLLDVFSSNEQKFQFAKDLIACRPVLKSESLNPALWSSQ